MDKNITFQNPTGGRDRWNNSLTHSSALRTSDSSFTGGAAPDAADDIKPYYTTVIAMPAL